MNESEREAIRARAKRVAHDRLEHYGAFARDVLALDAALTEAEALTSSTTASLYRAYADIKAAERTLEVQEHEWSKSLIAAQARSAALEEALATLKREVTKVVQANGPTTLSEDAATRLLAALSPPAEETTA